MFPPSAINNIRWRTYIIFAAFNAVFIPTVYFFFPETTNLQLEDVDYLFEVKGITGGARGEARKHIAARHDTENARKVEMGQLGDNTIGTEAKSAVEFCEDANAD
jgi:hypothetical protein